MCAYEFYWFDKAEKAHFIAILQEKRENLLRITRESVLTLGGKVIGSDQDVTNIYFIQVGVEQPLSDKWRIKVKGRQAGGNRK